MKLLASHKNYNLYRLNRTGEIVLRVVSITSSKSADHNKVDYLLDENTISRPITSDLIPIISDKFSKEGPSKAFRFGEKNMFYVQEKVDQAVKK